MSARRTGNGNGGGGTSRLGGGTLDDFLKRRDEAEAEAGSTGDGGAAAFTGMAASSGESARSGASSSSSSSKANVFTVTQALQLAKSDLEGIRISVEGEVSELSDKPGYKAVYFTIKDKRCAMPCLIWKNDFARQDIKLRLGMRVQATGNFSMHLEKGRMNFVARSLKPAGEGDLRMQVAMLAKKLQDEGLMEPSRKKAVPDYVQKVAVVTSPRGKAVHDVLRTLRRRSPYVEVYVCGVPVEGAQAPANICEGLRVADASDCDAILLVRGGGSYEDLMPFNDEKVARTVAACSKPVVTGIGHEPDNSIADMVGDLRCSTPTAAAEAVTRDVAQLSSDLLGAQRRMASALGADISYKGQMVRQLASRQLFGDPNYLLSQFAMRLDSDGDKLARAIPGAVERQKAAVARCAEDLRAAAGNVTSPSARRLETGRGKLAREGAHLLDDGKKQMAMAAARLNDLSPLSILGRGYSIAFDGDGHVVPRAVDVHGGDSLELKMQDGCIACTVDNVRLSGEGGSDDGAE